MGFSRELPLIKTGYWYVKHDGKLRDVLRQDIGIPESLLTDDFVAKIKRWNYLRSYEVKRGRRLYIEVPFLTRFNQRSIASIGRAPAVKTVRKVKRSGGRLSVFYALSKGVLSEQLNGSVESISSSQDMPLTVGLAYGKKLVGLWGYSGSFYLAKLDSGLSDQGEKVDYPWEYGMTSYLEYKQRGWFAKLYGGFDYEHFSSLNSDEVSQGYALSTREHSLGYLTLGMSRVFSLWRAVFTKVSMSYSVFSSQSRASLINSEPFSGVKFMFFASVKASRRWFYSCFYKQHILSGATSLQISRIGIGLGYSF